MTESAQTGPEAERAHRNLDAMIGLFEAATRFVDQMPGSSAELFLDYINAQDLPMDTLAARGKRYDAVEILTPALAAGRHWQTVYVCGLQDGTWPNTTVRGSLLKAGELTDICDMGIAAAQQVRMSDRVRAVRHDELRMFSTAISRANERLVVTAVSSTEDAPSEFFDILVPDARTADITHVRRPMTLRALVAELRRYAQAQDTDPTLANAAAAQLNRLAQAGAPGQPRNSGGDFCLSPPSRMRLHRIRIATACRLTLVTPKNSQFRYRPRVSRRFINRPWTGSYRRLVPRRRPIHHARWERSFMRSQKNTRMPTI